MRLVLASASPRRRELLKEICPEFDVIPARGEERADFSRSPGEIVSALAARKAEEAYRSAAQEAGEPRLSELFAQLAREEAEHLRTFQAALEQL